MRKNLLFLALICCALSVCAQNKLSNYTRSYLLDTKHETRDTRREARDVEMVSAFVHFNDVIDVALLEMYGAIVESKFETLNLVTATIPAQSLEALAEEEAIRYIEMGTPPTV